jgi:hypothetical protein
MGWCAKRGGQPGMTRLHDEADERERTTCSALLHDGSAEGTQTATIGKDEQGPRHPLHRSWGGLQTVALGWRAPTTQRQRRQVRTAMLRG